MDPNTIVDRSHDVLISFSQSAIGGHVEVPDQAGLFNRLVIMKLLKVHEVEGISSSSIGQYYILMINLMSKMRLIKALNGNKRLYDGLTTHASSVDDIVKVSLTYVNIYRMPMQMDLAHIKPALAKYVPQIKRIWKGKLKQYSSIDNGVRHFCYETPEGGPCDIPHFIFINEVRCRISYRGQPENPKLCFNCGVTGHFAHNCKDPIMCLKCDTLGHTQNNCHRRRNMPLVKRQIIVSESESSDSESDDEKQANGDLETNDQDQSMESNDPIDTPKTRALSPASVLHRQNMGAALKVALQKAVRERESRLGDLETNSKSEEDSPQSPSQTEMEADISVTMTERAIRNIKSIRVRNSDSVQEPTEKSEQFNNSLLEDGELSPSFSEVLNQTPPQNSSSPKKSPKRRKMSEKRKISPEMLKKTDLWESKKSSLPLPLSKQAGQERWKHFVKGDDQSPGKIKSNLIQ